MNLKIASKAARVVANQKVTALLVHVKVGQGLNVARLNVTQTEYNLE